jgi:rhodanese-related sulfurtransferase
MSGCPKQLRCRARRHAGWLLAAVLALAPLSSWAGHDQVEDDLVYFLRIQPDRVKQLLDGGEAVWLVDLRDTEEFKRQHLPGAHSIPLKQLQKSFMKVPRTGRVVLYCSCPEGNVDEGYSYQLLRELGYRNVSVLEGGFTEWTRLGYPVETDGNS